MEAASLDMFALFFNFIKNEIIHLFLYKRSAFLFSRKTLGNPGVLMLTSVRSRVFKLI